MNYPPLNQRFGGGTFALILVKRNLAEVDTRVQFPSSTPVIFLFVFLNICDERYFILRRFLFVKICIFAKAFSFLGINKSAQLSYF